MEVTGMARRLIDLIQNWVGHWRGGLLMAHFAIRGLMHEAALKADEDPDRLSFVHSVHVVQRRMARYGAIPPSAEKSATRSDPQ